MDEPEWWMPTAWPVFWRRVFLLTLPVSGMIWLFAMFVLALTLMVVATVVIPIMTAKERLWDRKPSETKSVA